MKKPARSPFRPARLAACLAGLGLLLSACGPRVPAGEIPVGEYGSLTGSDATFGVSTDQGIRLAVAEVNAAGGIDGKKVDLIAEDDEGKPEEAAVVATKLITQDGVKAVLGEVASSNSLAAAPICQAHQVPMISPSSTNVAVTQKGDYIFRVCFIDSFQGKVMADFAFHQLKARRAAIFRDEKSDYSVGLSSVFAQVFKRLGGTIVSDQSYSAGDMDFKAQLAQMRGSRPDVIYVPGYYTEVGLIAKQARDLGMKQPLLGGDGWDSSQLYSIGGSALDGCYFSDHYSAESKDPRVVSFLAKYRAAYGGKTPDALAVLGYDAANVLFAAMKRAKSLSGPDLRDAIAATRDFPGVSGNITLDKDRNAVKPAVVLRIENGAAHYVATIQP